MTRHLTSTSRSCAKAAARAPARAPAFVAVLAASVGCAGGSPAASESATEGTTGSTDTDGDTEAGDLDPERHFEPITPAAALHKVKTFLVGVAPTSEEYAAYASDAAALPGMIDGWMALPEFEPRAKEMLAFMFQQGASSDDIGLIFREQNTDIFQQREGRGGVDLEGPMRQSWALTAWRSSPRGGPSPR